MSKPAARLTDPVAHPLPPILTGGPGAITVMIGNMPAWRGVVAAAAAALQAAKTVSDSAIKAAEAATLAAAGTPGAPAAKAAEEATKAAAAASMGSMISSMAAGADIHMCSTPLPAPPHGPGVVIDGSPTVLINNLPAATAGNTVLEAVGPPNKIVMGMPTVLIGTSGGSGAGGGGGGGGGGFSLDAAGTIDELGQWLDNLTQPESKQQEFYADGIIIEGTEAFRTRVKMDLAVLASTPTGQAVLESIQDSGKTMTIVESKKGNSEDATSFTDGLRKADGTPGPGTDTTVNFNPNKTQIGDGSEPWMKRPTSVGLGHEMIHGAHDMNGTTAYDHANPTKKPQNYEPQTVGLKATDNGNPVDYANEPYTENKLREDLGQPKRPRY